VRSNLVALGLTANTRVVCQDSLAYLAHAKEPFDLVFLDPPYAAGLLEPALTAVAPLVREGGVIVCESESDTPLPEQVGGASLYRRYRYGRVTVRIYRV
jgi:16S rRNA (guanine966-N2)-methyltransferase